MSDASGLDGDEINVFRAFNRSARTVNEQLDADLRRDTGPSRAHFEILWCLSEAPGRARRMSDLAKLTESTRSLITYLISQLEELGQVEKRNSPEDRRVWYAVLTDEGLNVLQQAVPRYTQSVRQNCLQLLSPDQREQLKRISETLLEGGRPI